MFVAVVALVTIVAFVAVVVINFVSVQDSMANWVSHFASLPRGHPQGDTPTIYE